MAVTSDLDPPCESEDDGQGGDGIGRRSRPPKSFVIKIMTFNPQGLKILQTLLAKPAPVKPFPWSRERGVSLAKQNLPPKTSLSGRLNNIVASYFSARNQQAGLTP